MNPRCVACPGVHTCVPPSGPQARGGILFIGEAPGQTEDRKGIPFVGKTGDEVNRHYLPLAGLRRDQVTFTNAIRCLPDTPQGKLDPHKEAHLRLLSACSMHHLHPLIAQMQPRLLVPLGAFACKAVFNEPFDLEVQHGIPIESPWGPAFPMYHPALGLHSPKQMLYIRTDWDRLRKHLRGSLYVPTDPFAGFEEYREASPEDVEAVDQDTPLACDTESSPSLGPYCLTFSQSPGTGRLIRCVSGADLDAFQRALDRHRAPILFHNWLYDWTITEAMGLRIQPQRVVDTMAVIYHLGSLPQGLKALAFRELGMTMQAFEDVVLPHSSLRAFAYLELASFEDWPDKPAQTVIGPDGEEKPYQPNSIGQKLKALKKAYRKDPTLDLFDRWAKWEADQADIEAVCGPFPQPDIAHVPFDEVLHYACRDADALIRLWPLIRKMRTFVRRASQERWAEKAHALIDYMDEVAYAR